MKWWGVIWSNLSHKQKPAHQTQFLMELQKSAKSDPFWLSVWPAYADMNMII